MKITKKTNIQQVVELDEKDIEGILRMYIIENLGQDWANSSYDLWQQLVEPYLGQLDDEYETKASFVIVRDE